jgi:hypothetical protein
VHKLNMYHDDEDNDNEQGQTRGSAPEAGFVKTLNTTETTLRERLMLFLILAGKLLRLKPYPGNC